MSEIMTCILKKSVTTEYGTRDISDIGDFSVDWVRAMTCKEALNKIDNASEVKAVVIEDAKDKDESYITEIINTGVKVILLGGGLLVAGATVAQNVSEVKQLLVKVGVGESLENDEPNEDIVIKKIDAEEEERLQQIAGGQLLNMNGVDSARYDAVVEEKNRFRNLYENTLAELKALKATLDNIMIDEEVAEFMASGVDGKELKRQLELSKAEVDRLNRKITELGAEKSERRTAETRLEKAEEELTKAKIIHDVDTEALDVLRQTIMQISFYGREIIEQISDAHLEVKHHEENEMEFKKAADKANKNLSDALAKINELEQKIDSLVDNVEELKETNEELSLDIVHLEDEKKRLNGELTATRDKLNKEIEKEEKALDNIEEKERALAEFRAYKIDEMEAELAQSRDMIKEYNTALSDLNIKNDAYRQEIMELRQKVEAYSEMASKANNKLIARDRYINGDVSSPIKLDYVGKAIVVAVYGSGGYGTTAVATGLAEKLVASGKDVAIVDLDFRSPKMESCYNINPFKECLSSDIVEELRRTSVGALIKIGGHAWADKCVQLGDLINIKKKRAEGRLVFHAGTYASLNATEIAGADYSTLLRKLGIEFDYVILDMGRLEGTGAISNVQVGISNAVNQCFLVTNSSLADIRSMNVRVMTSKFRIKNTCWVTNMKDGKLAPSAETILNLAESYAEIPLIRECYGTSFSLAENRKTSSALDMLLAYIN